MTGKVEGEWAAPIVAVLKADGKSVRICGDFKVTINQATKLISILSQKLKIFWHNWLQENYSLSLIGLPAATFNEESKKYLVINTHRGLFRYNRLPLRAASAPGIFQRVMENLLSSIPGVVVYTDDIVITGKTEADHLATLEEVLKTVENVGL